jgi:RND family efflux transporter MFP subunit
MRGIVALHLLLGGLVLMLAGCGGESSNAETRADPDSAATAVLGPNDVARVEKTDIVEGIPLSGTLQPAVDVRIASPVPEVIEQVLVNEGDAVRKGQVLARFQTGVLAPQAASAETQRRIAQADYERMKNLFAEGAVSQKDVENAELQLRSAEALEAQARKRLEDATIRAPSAGVISERLVESGNRVKDGDHLFQLVNTDQLEFQATVPSQYAGELKPGARVTLNVTGAGTGAGAAGKVSRINAAVDPSTRQVKVYVVGPNPRHRMVGGLFASGRVVLREARGALAVPSTGVRQDGDKNYVMVVDNDRVARREVLPGLRDEVRGLTEIRQGLNPGEIAIVGPAEGMKAGDPVQVVGREG